MMMDGGKPIESTPTPVEPEPVVVDYSLEANAQQNNVPDYERQYPVYEQYPILQLPTDPNFLFEHLSIGQQIVYFAQRRHNDGDYINKMFADMQVLIHDDENNAATKGRAEVNAAFIANVGNLGANDTLRGYVNWILGINDGRSTSNWTGWWGGWLSVQEWFDTIVPANIKSSLVDPSS